MDIKKIALLGGGELGKEFAIAAKRLGHYICVIDRYSNHPAGQVADKSFVCDMLNKKALTDILNELQPDIIVPEIEAIDTNILFDYENKGVQIVPSAKTVSITMDRKKLREHVRSLHIPTVKYQYANKDNITDIVKSVGVPCVIKPLMSSSGKGQSVIKHVNDAVNAYTYAMDNMRGNSNDVIVERFVNIKAEYTVLVIKPKHDYHDTVVCTPIIHKQKNGDYQWSTQGLSRINVDTLGHMHDMAIKMVESLPGCGVFGVEFIETDDDLFFSEVSPRPHDTGMVTMISQNTDEFELHLKAILGLPITFFDTECTGGASVVILSEKEGIPKHYNIDNTFNHPVKIRIFGKPEMHVGRRMGVVLSKTLDMAKIAAQKVTIE